MESPGATSLGATAEEFYSRAQSLRTGPVAIGRRIADLSIPSAFPPEEWTGGQDLKTTNQSINAGCINNLAQMMTSVALPPNLPIVRYETVDGRLQEEMKADPEAARMVRRALVELANKHRVRIASTMAEAAYMETSRQLLIVGNAAVLWTKIDSPVVYNLHRYVVQRMEDGTALRTVVATSVPYAAADDDVRAAADSHRQGRAGAASLRDESIRVYHVEVLERDGDDLEYHYWQEVEGGYVLPGTEAYSPVDAPAIYPAAMNLGAGKDYGLPYALDYEGDHMAVENYEAALQDSAAAAALTLLLVRPGGLTKIEDVRDARNLDVKPGDVADVGAFRLDKNGDMRFVAERAETATRRLGAAYSMESSIQRSGERVTAEEWRRMYQALTRAMGNAYTRTSAGFQRWFVLRFLLLHGEENKSLSALPKGLVRPTPITGSEALGQSTEYSEVFDWATEQVGLLGPEALASEIDPAGWLQHTAGLRGINTAPFLKTAEAKQAQAEEAQAAMAQQTVLDKATGPMAKQGAEMMARMMQQQQGEAQSV